MSHAGKKIVIYGGGNGFGLLLVEFFLDQGAHVLVADPSRHHLDNCKARHAKERPHCASRTHYQHCEASNEASARALCSLGHEHLKHIDVFIYYAPMKDGHRAAGECETEHWHHVMSHQATGLFHIKKHLLPIFQKQHKERGPNACAGQFINLCSNAAIKGGYSGAACTAAQHAVVGLSHNTSINYAKENIYSCVGILGNMTIEVFDEVIAISPSRVDITIEVYSKVSTVKEQSAAHYIGTLCHGENAHMTNGSVHYMTGNHPAC